jgi:hypothetical protein
VLRTYSAARVCQMLLEKARATRLALLAVQS